MGKKEENFIGWLNKNNFQLNKKIEIFGEEEEERGVKSNERIENEERLFVIPHDFVLSSTSPIFELIRNFEIELAKKIISNEENEENDEKNAKNDEKNEKICEKKEKTNKKVKFIEENDENEEEDEEKNEEIENNSQNNENNENNENEEDNLLDILRNKYIIELEWLELVILLLYEKNNKMSKWREYIDFLPSHLNVPISWSKLEQSFLNSAEFSFDFQLLSFPFEDFVLPFFQAHFPAFLSQIKEEEYRWGLSIISSYSFSEEGKVGLYPLADTLNHKTGFNNARLFFPSENNENNENNDENEENNEENEEKDYKNDGKKELLRMEAIKVIEKGGEIYNTYGELSNSELLRKYGFVDQINEFDCITFSVDQIISEISNFLEQIQLGKRKKNIKKIEGEKKRKKVDGEDSGEEKNNSEGDDEENDEENVEERLDQILDQLEETSLLENPFKVFIDKIKIPNEMLQLIGCLLMDEDEISEFFENYEEENGEDEEEDEENDEIKIKEEKEVVWPKDKKNVYQIIKKLIENKLEGYQPIVEYNGENQITKERWNLSKFVRDREIQILSSLLQSIQSFLN